MTRRIDPTVSNNAPWAPAKVELLTKLWTDGLSASKVAAELRITRNAVIGKVHRLGLTRSEAVTRANIASSQRDRQTGRRRTVKTGAPKVTSHAHRNPFGGKLARMKKAKASGGTPRPRSQPLPIPTLIEVGTARPWITRESGECAYPVFGEGADTYSCCGKVRRGSRYCKSHRSIMFTGAPAPNISNANAQRRSQTLGSGKVRVA